MAQRSDGFAVAQEDKNEVSNSSVVIISSKLELGEFSISIPGYHGIGLSPSFETTVPSSYDSAKWKDFDWAPNTYGYLPPTMKQAGVLKSTAKSTNIMISDKFFRTTAGDDIKIDGLDFRNLVGVDDPVGANLMLALGSIANSGTNDEWPILIDTIGAALSIRIMKQLGAKLYSQDLRAGKIHRVLDYINDNLERTLNLDELANVACLSRFHFARQFKLTFGKTPHDYVMERRVHKAVKLIRKGNMALSLIAVATGFCSQAHMTKTMRAHTGHTPGQIQRDAGIRLGHQE